MPSHPSELAVEVCPKGIALVVGFFVLSSACGHQTARTAPRPGATEVKSSARQAEAAPVDMCGFLEPGIIDGRRLDLVVGKGPGWVLSRIHVARFPPSGQGPFQGWRVVDISDPCIARVLQPGDVVLNLNGKGLERPEDLWGVWQSLGRADRLQVRMVRNGRQVTLTLRIRRHGEGRPAVTGPTAP